jgi:hypothetical protein
VEVRVKLLLQGGHVWEFCCADDDPIVFGLVSALPGADVADNLPRDGLVQIETRSGERLFLTRSSLVSVEVVPVGEPLKFLGTKRLAGPLHRIPARASFPCPFVLMSDALSDDVHSALIAHSLSQDTGGLQSGHELRELNLGPLAESVTKALRSHMESGRAILGTPDQVEVELELRLYAIGDTQAVSCHANRANALQMVYYFHRQPKGFTGGGVRLFDSRTENGMRRGSFRDLEIGDNVLLIFPENAVSAGLPVRCPTRAFGDGLFVIQGSLR